MLPQSRGRFHIEFVKRDDSVQLFVAGEMGYCFHAVGQWNRIGKVVSIVETFARPVRVTQFLCRQQEHPASLALALAHELLPFFVGGYAEESQWTFVGHRRDFGSGLGGYHAHRSRKHSIFWRTKTIR